MHRQDAETVKVTHILELLLDAQQRQTLALERIAAAMESRDSRPEHRDTTPTVLTDAELDAQAVGVITRMGGRLNWTKIGEQLGMSRKTVQRRAKEWPRFQRWLQSYNQQVGACRTGFVDTDGTVHADT